MKKKEFIPYFFPNIENERFTIHLDFANFTAKGKRVVFSLPTLHINGEYYRLKGKHFNWLANLPTIRDEFWELENIPNQ